MKKTLTLIIASVTVSCGSVESNLSESNQTASKKFNLSLQQDDVMSPCKFYIELNKTTQNISLQNKRVVSPRAFCPTVEKPADFRLYLVTDEQIDGCGTKTTTAVSKNGKIVIRDHSNLTCRIMMPAKVIVEETRSGKSEKLYLINENMPQENKQKTLSCVETSTFSDGPGNEYRIAIARDGVNGFVTSRAIRMRGMDETKWKLESESVQVKEFESGLNISENVDSVDWSKTDSCYKFSRSTQFNLTKAGAGYSGTVTQGGFVQVDPEATDCNFPHVMPARPKKIVCSLY